MFGYEVPVMGGYPYNQNTTKKIQNYQFKLNEVLGKGNFSKVYRGINELNNEPVAIKVVELSSIKTPALVDLLYSEIDIVKTLKHPNILRCYEVFTSANNCYIITELCDGDLETRIRTKGAMSERQAYKTIFQTFLGLKYLAQQSIVHRDFKIANVLFNKGVAKIADFGFAKRTKQRWKDINIGSPIYMSPQGLIDHIYGPKTDIWAYGIFIYEILHGDTPLSFCQNEQQLKMHIRNPIKMNVFNPKLSNQVKDLIIRCLDIDQRRRVSIQEIEQMPLIRRLARDFGYPSAPQAMYQMPSQPMQNQQMHGQSIQNVNMSVAPMMTPMSQMSPMIQNVMPMPPMPIVSPPMNPKMNVPMVAASQQFYQPPPQVFQEGQRVPEAMAVQMKSMQNQGYLQIPQHQNFQTRPISANPSPLLIRLDQDSNKSGSFKNDRSERQGISLDKTDSRQKMVRPASSYNNIPDESSTTYGDSYKIVNKTNTLNFQECVTLLHYCRLIYKTAIQMQKLQKMMTRTPKEYLTNWLFDIFKEIETKIPAQVKFEGEKGKIREKKLKQVISEYHKKYYKDLQQPPYEETTLQGLQEIIPPMIKQINELLQDNSITERRNLIMAAHYLVYLYETNTVLQKCVQTSDYSTFSKKCNIELFLNNKKDTFDENSYVGLQAKSQRMFAF